MRGPVAASERSQVAELADGEGGDGGEGRSVLCVDDKAGDGVLFVRDDEVFEEGGEEDVGESHLGDDALLGGFCG